MKYRRIEPLLEAVQWNGDFNEIAYAFPGIICAETEEGTLHIDSPVGLMVAEISDYIVKVKGHFFVSEKESFEKNYELFKDDPNE
jgi:hypothetical protein